SEFRSQESGVRSQNSGVRSQESGVRIQESEFRIQESEFRSQESGVKSALVLAYRFIPINSNFVLFFIGIKLDIGEISNLLQRNLANIFFNSEF
ncbi:hypothetical protein VF12_33185, partial [Nostoc linckia z15]